MKHPHIATGKHMDGPDPRFRINTSPGIMAGVNEAHGSYLQHHHVVELRDELNEWLAAHPTDEEVREAERQRHWQEGYEAGRAAAPCRGWWTEQERPEHVWTDDTTDTQRAAGVHHWHCTGCGEMRTQFDATSPS